MLPAKIYSFTIPASGMFELPVVGSYFKVLSSTAGFNVFGDSFGNVGALLAGQGLRDTDFTKLQFVDTSGANNLLRVLVAGQSFVDDRITGEVSVVDGSRATTLAKQAFIVAVAASCGAGQTAATALWNLSAPGSKNLRLKQLRYDSVIAGPVSIIHRRITTVAGWTADNFGNTKFLDGTLSANGRCYYQNNAAAVPANDSPMGVDLSAGSRIVSFQEPIVLPPSCGYAVMFNNMAATGACSINATFEFVEDSVQ